MAESTRNSRAKQLRQQANEAIEELFAQLKQGHTQAFLEYLEFMGQFHDYSYANQILIRLARPTATLVAGLRAWNRMGRRVKKGEKGIPILAPLYKKEELIIQETGERKSTYELKGFRTVYVFDIAQTVGEPLDVSRFMPTGTKEPGLYKRLAAVCPYPIKEETGLEYGSSGWTDGTTIHISAELSEERKAEVLLHEWTHCLLHFDDSENQAESQNREVYAQHELEAEMTAYIVGRTLGLAMTSSRDYILHWKPNATEELKGGKVLARVNKAAKDIFQRLEPKQDSTEQGREEAA